MSESEQQNLQRRFVSILQTVLPSTGGTESLQLLLSSLEACLLNDRSVFVPPLQPSNTEHAVEFTMWVLLQLAIIYTQMPDNKASSRVRAFFISLLRTLQARNPALLCGPVLDTWVISLQQLTAKGSTHFQPSVFHHMPSLTVELASSDRVRLLRLLLCSDVTSLFMLTNSQLDNTASLLSRLRTSDITSDVVTEVLDRLLIWRSTDARHRYGNRCSPSVQSLPTPSPQSVAASLPTDQRSTADQLISQLTTQPTDLRHDSSLIRQLHQQLQQMEEAERNSVHLQVLNACLIGLLSAAAPGDLFRWCVLCVSPHSPTGCADLSVALVSLPWVGHQVGWCDLRLDTEVRSRVEQAAARLTGVCDQLTSLCLPIVCQFPRSVCPQWRWTLVERLLGTADSLPDCWQLLPWCCVSLPRPALSCLLAHCTTNPRPDNDDFTAALSQTLCLVSGHVSYTRDRNEYGACERLSVYCALCQPLVTPPPDASRDLLTWPADCQLQLLETLLSACVSQRDCGHLVSCLHHAPQTDGVVARLLATPPVADWSAALRAVISADAHWSSAQTLICDWLAAEAVRDPDSEQLARLFHIIVSPLNEDSAAGWLIRPAGADVWRLTSGCITSLLTGLTRLMMSQQSALAAATAHLGVDTLSRRLKLTPAALFQLYKTPIYRVIAQQIVDGGLVLSQLGSLASGWEFRDTCSLLRSGLRHILPVLVVSMATSGSDDYLTALATSLKTKRKDLLIDNYPFILSHLVLSNRRQLLHQRVHHFISTTIGVTMDDIRRCSIQGQINELLFGLGTHREDVIRELGCLVLLDTEHLSRDTTSVAAGISTDAMDENSGEQRVTLRQLVQYLSPRVLGVLGWADAQLGSRSVSAPDKRQLLDSIGHLCQLLGGEHLSPVGRKVLATLRAGLDVPDADLAPVWSALIRSLDAETLRSMAAEILVLLLSIPLPQRDPVIRCLLQERHSDLSTIIDELPDVSDGCGTWSSLKQQQGSATPLTVILSRTERTLRHQSPLVRQHALLTLRRVLQQHRAQMELLCASRDGCDEYISPVVQAVLASCKDADADSQILIAECIGAIGAVDPVRLQLEDRVCGVAAVSCLPAVHSDQFASSLLAELCRTFTSTEEPVTQACAGFAMQELLKIYGMHETDTALWSSLPADLRQVLGPMRHSQYQLSASRSKEPPSPIYASHTANAHSDWIGLWLSRLVSYVSGRQAGLVLAAVRPAACRDSLLATFLLPHAFVSAVIDGAGEAALQQIVDELRAVLSAQTQQQDSSYGRQCCRSVFSVLDAINSWQFQQLSSCGTNIRQLDALRSSDVKYRAVTALQQMIPYDLVAEAARACGAYKRALQAMEIHIKRHPDQLSMHLPFLQDIYVLLSEADGVAGVAASRVEAASIHDQLILHRSRGQIQDALSCYELVCSIPGSELDGYRGLISCYLSLDQPNTALGVSRELITSHPHWEEDLGDMVVESVWRLGRWDDLQAALDCAPLDRWSSTVGFSLLFADGRREAEFDEIMSYGRELEMSVLCSAALEKGSYSRAYEHIVRLHILSDVEHFVRSLLWSDDPGAAVCNLVQSLRSRLELVQPSAEALEPVLTVHRAVLTLARDRMTQRGHVDAAGSLDLEIGRSWLHSARLSRECGRLQHAGSCLLQLECRSRQLPAAAFIEHASLLWQRGEGDAAIRTLRQGVQRHFPDWQQSVKAGRMMESERHTLAEAQLRLARYCEESANMDSTVIRQHFVDATEIRKDWEDVHFYMAKYLDRLMLTLPPSSHDPNMAVRVLHALGKSLQYGCRHVYESMPRLLSIWLDSGGGGREDSAGSSAIRTPRSSQHTTTQQPASAKTLDLMNKLMSQLPDRLPLYCFLTSLPQIISRICHSNPHIYSQIRHILARLLSAYPQQCVWYMLAVSKSSYPMRVERCLDVFAKVRAEKQQLGKFIADATRLADKLVDLSNKPVEKKASKISMSTFFPSMRRLICDGFSSILVPLQQQMTVNLPESSDQHGASYRPFPEPLVCIAGFEDDIEVMTSLVKPKKIAIRGTDGRKYTMMAKPKDDLRKDCRLMEFNGLVNRQLGRHDEARRRSLRIRTYSVVPLNEECGLLEWVPHLTGMRQALMTLYRQLGSPMTLTEVKQCCAQLDDSLEKKRAVFVDTLLARHPPVLSRWFLANFQDPQAWYSARLNYARTTAVMSMIGYILGLGDRHGENILLDSASGDCVHVDFNCLFNKGELFDWPERVPFRMTQNMIDALGPTGVEGTYRTACEVTMSVMREQREGLMCVLRPFVHDPLVEWSKQERKTRDVAEIVNEKAQAHVGDIEQRLRGQVRSRLKPMPIPLSVPGQVNYLIDEATGLDNLCQMYIGWAPYY